MEDFNIDEIKKEVEDIAKQIQENTKVIVETLLNLVPEKENVKNNFKKVIDKADKLVIDYKKNLYSSDCELIKSSHNNKYNLLYNPLYSLYFIYDTERKISFEISRGKSKEDESFAMLSFHIFSMGKL